MRIALLPTGRMEWFGLRLALARLFPACEFYSVPTQAEIDSQRDIQFPASSFTSGDVTKLGDMPNNADKLVQRAAAEALGDRARPSADLVIILDDVELDNLAQPEAIVEVMRQATRRHLATLSHNTRLQEKTAALLRARVSFHLAKPMIESWLFADPSALAIAGVPLSRTPQRQPGDPEQFIAMDPGYDEDDGSTCTCWHALAERTPAQRKAKRKARPAWLKAQAQRNLHPKAYLAWLCQAPEEPTCSHYAETSSGASALAALRWERLLSDPHHAPFARAMIHDIADACGAPEPFPGSSAPLVSRHLSGPEALLRNL